MVVATGALYRRLEAPGCRALEGMGVHYAATAWEAQHVPVAPGGRGRRREFRRPGRPLPGRPVAPRLPGGAGESLAKDMSRYLIDRIESEPRIEVLLHTEVRAAQGEKAIESIVVEDNRTGEQRTLPVGALFVFIGAKPGTDWLAGALSLDDHGAVLTGRAAAESGREQHWRHLAREPYVLETSRPGVFAAGDVRSGSIKRVASAVGEGSMSVRLVHEYLRETGASADR